MGSWLYCCCCSVAQSCLTLCNPEDCSVPGFPVLHHFPGLVQTHVRWVCDAIQPSRPLSSPSPPAFNLSQHQGLFYWVISLHQVANQALLILKYPLLHQGRYSQHYLPLTTHVTSSTCRLLGRLLLQCQWLVQWPLWRMSFLSAEFISFLFISVSPALEHGLDTVKHWNMDKHWTWQNVVELINENKRKNA